MGLARWGKRRGRRGGDESSANQGPVFEESASGNRNARASYAQRPIDECRDASSQPCADAEKLPRVRLADYSRLVIHADVISRPEYVEGAHNTGVNATFGDGSARWIERQAFDANLELLRASLFEPANDDLILTADGSAGIFADLDAAR